MLLYCTLAGFLLHQDLFDGFRHRYIIIKCLYIVFKVLSVVTLHGISIVILVVIFATFVSFLFMYLDTSIVYIDTNVRVNVYNHADMNTTLK